MKFMSTWSLREGQTAGAARRFLAGEGKPPEGVKLLGRWHATDLSCGWSLTESDDAAALMSIAVNWVDELEINTVPVVEDEVAGKVLAAKYGG